LKAEGNCVIEGTEESWPPKVGWRATGGESVGPYVRNSIRPDVLASLLGNGEAQETRGCRRETALPGKSPEREANKRDEAAMEGHRVVGDRTTEKFRCSESGRSTASR
jgi:hypothetical protein